MDEPVAGSTRYPELAASARRFIAAAFDVLTRDHVIPRPPFHPFVQVGVDFYGPDIMSLAASSDFEQKLKASFPNRFDQPLEARDPEFASTYVFSFLDSAVALCSKPSSTRCRSRRTGSSKRRDGSLARHCTTTA